MRGACSSAYTETVKPAGTVGITPSGLGTMRLAFGATGPGGGRASARGCGAVAFCCATTSAPVSISDPRQARKTARFINNSFKRAESGDPTADPNQEPGTWNPEPWRLLFHPEFGTTVARSTDKAPDVEP